MEYLFLRRKNRNTTSERQKRLISKAVEKQWKEDFVRKGVEGRKIDFEIYKSLLYLLEIRMVFLDTSLSLDKLSALVRTNQTYMSNVVNRYFGCNLHELINSYRIEYAKELLRSGKCLMRDVPGKCGFTSKSTFYNAFGRMVGCRPVEYIRRNGVEEEPEEDNLYLL